MVKFAMQLGDPQAFETGPTVELDVVWLLNG
jgi:hypothetical protein